MTEAVLSSPIRTPHWTLPEGVKAFYTTRKMGVSQPPYESNNLAMHVGDNPADVQFNRDALPCADSVAWLTQVHGIRCIRITKDYFLPLEVAKADASFTTERKSVCAVMTADCMPILVANTAGTCVASIHAGWRGLANGIIENTIAAMNCEPGALTVWIGPHISQRHFQVSEDLRKVFAQYPEAFVKDTVKGKYLCSLAQIAREKCHSIGVGSFVESGICTYVHHGDFYSHRYAQHHGQAQTGRFVCGIYLQ
ncbi:peptidoglycan editing factor PgeF [Aliiglaciecola sp. 2_MG-2023]|uniref:peptidoglycan editing factor PgeF n=1 Tax=unclassified Aliiglaciecola TaxID=2593648 RepID=UPI0026E250F8|nr:MULTISPECIES: peptidoglycan editing factor PgeF [unclassified Aliiglaciecola]MDO6709925.1 peptidoglycan editing factor PgeF [Aliiglaciecola sp. 2_MG-2023]MDO6751073.1 peptidoglycan editing factor PgeF [Aliiglaciecola sp. 1_MG-2023]